MQPVADVAFLSRPTKNSSSGAQPAINSPRTVLAPFKPLPPQKWGVWATNEFWVLASLTPITLLFWGAVPFFFALIEYLGFTWWQSALAFWVFFGVWGGLVERWSRQYLAARRPALEPSARSQEAQGASLAQQAAAPIHSPPHIPTTEDWNVFFRRVFGRLAGVASVASDVAFFLLFFYPGWLSKLVAILLMMASFLIVRGCTRRWRAESIQPPPLSAGASGPRLPAGDDR